MRQFDRLRLFLGLLLVVSACMVPSAFAEQMRILAIVNDEVITQKEFNQALAPVYMRMRAVLKPGELEKELVQVRKDILNKLIEEKIMLQLALDPKPVEVAKGKIGTPPPVEVSDSAINQMLDEAAAQFDSQEQFQMALNDQGIEIEDLKDRYRKQLIVQKFINREVRSRVNIPPSEITAYYEQNKSEFKSPEAVEVAAILIKPEHAGDIARAQQLAADLRRRLIENKANFYDLARRYSDGLNSKMGGRMGHLEKGRSRPEIEEELFALKPGEISSVIKTPSGFHVFLIESKRASEQATLDESAAKIRAILIREGMAERYSAWMKKLKQDAYIEIRVTDPNPSDT